MKRLFLLIAVCMIGMVLPQGMWAGVTIDTSTSGKVVVTSENAGDFAAYLNSATTEQLNALKVNEIVFVGNFNESDLSTLKEKNCATQKKVDMAEAKFIKSASSGSNYVLYHNSTPNSGQEGQHCIVGATKYISAKSNTWTLTEINEDQLGNGQSWKEKNVLADDASTITDYNYEAYVKLPTTLNYYKYNSSNNSFELIENPTEEQISSATAAPDDCSSSNINNFGYLGQNGQSIIKVRPADGTYRFFKSEAPFVWDTAANLNQNDYSDGDTVDPSLYYSSIDLADAPTDHGQNVYAGGVEYIYNNNQWVLASEVSSGNEEYDYTQMKFDYWGNNVEEIITSQYAEGPMVDQLCDGCSNLKTLTLSAGDFSNTAMGNSVNSLETLYVKNQVTALGRAQFEGIGTLSTVNFEETSKITVLPAQVFNRTGITSLTVPSSVQDIKSNAFGNCLSLKTVTINENTSLHHIRTDAFQGSNNIEDVWVNVNPLTHPIVCEYNAFGEYSLVGQTQEGDLEDAKMATLHFNKDYWDYYAGDWKLGMTFNQANLDAIKDGCNPNATGDVLIDLSYSGQDRGVGVDINGRLNRSSNGHVDGTSPANGWQQFARTSTGIDIIIPEGKFYRTYSTPSALVKPDWMKIYRVKDFQDGYEVGTSDASSAEQANAAEKKALTEEITPTVTGSDGKTYKIIPVNTGVIRVDNRDSEALYYILELERTSAANAYEQNASSLEYPYSESGNKVNYMYPTNGEPATIGPVIKNGSEIAYRIFGLLKVKQKGEIPQFSRAKVGTKLGDHRAYLKLPASVFHWQDEKNGSSQDATNNDVVVDENNTYAKISLFFDEDFEDLNGGIATEIINSIEEDMYKNDSFYTLQGVKVAKPTTKGVYIHNGKKILIK